MSESAVLIRSLEVEHLTSGLRDDLLVILDRFVSALGNT